MQTREKLENASVKFNKRNAPYDIFANTTPTKFDISIAGDTYHISMLEQAFQALKDIDDRGNLGQIGKNILSTMCNARGSEVQKAGQNHNITLKKYSDKDNTCLLDDVPFDANTDPTFSQNREIQYTDALTVKEQKMRELLLIKFTQDISLLTALLDTENATLIEDTLTENLKGRGRVDSFWGNSYQTKNGKPPGNPGHNALSKALFDVRNQLQQELNETNKIQVRTTLSDAFCTRVGLDVTTPTDKAAHHSKDSIDQHRNSFEYQYFKANKYRAAYLPQVQVDKPLASDTVPVTNNGLAKKLGENGVALYDDILLSIDSSQVCTELKKQKSNPALNEMAQWLIVMQDKLSRKNDLDTRLAIIEECNERCKVVEKKYGHVPGIKRAVKAVAVALITAACVVGGAVLGSVAGFIAGVPGGPLASVSALLGLVAGAKAGLAAAAVGASALGLSGFAASTYVSFFKPSISKERRMIEEVLHKTREIAQTPSA